MKTRYSVLSMMLWLFAVHVSAQVLEIPEKYVADVRAAEEEGALMYKFDQAAWRATDATEAIKGFHHNRKIRGWVTEEVAETIRVTFYGVNAGKRVALFRALVSPGGLMAERPVSLGKGEPLSEFEGAQAAARETALGMPIQTCASAYNSIALLRTKDDKKWWSFYILPATSESGVIMAGIVYRVDVDWNGETILNQRAFSKSCIKIGNEPHEPGTQSAGLYLTHLLDEVPTPVHVFLSLQHHEPIAVLTTQNSLAWMVTGGHMLLLDLKKSTD